MEKLLDKYSQKLIDAGLVEDNSFMFMGLDDEIICRGEKRIKDIDLIFDSISINSLLFAEPKEPYRSILNFFTERVDDKIEPSDCETRTFLHDLPVIKEYSYQAAAEKLKSRKCVIIDGVGVITYGSVTPEQCFVTLSSVCFSTFVKFFSDYLTMKKDGDVDNEMQKVFDFARGFIHPYPDFNYDLATDIFSDEGLIYSAVSEAGRKTVEYGLVDSFFGNVSAFYNGNVYISQTGSSLDELDGYIDACPSDGSTCSGLTASSELSAHMKVITETGAKTILHGHPLFSVILSMDCEKKNCENMGSCFKVCHEKREIRGVPIVPGEVGVGPFGLCNTIPPVLKEKDGVIVYGHGVFTTGDKDFNKPFKRLLEIESMCMEEYFKMTL